MKPKANQFRNESLLTFSSAMIRSSGAWVARSEALSSEVKIQTLRPFSAWCVPSCTAQTDETQCRVQREDAS